MSTNLADFVDLAAYRREIDKMRSDNFHARADARSAIEYTIGLLCSLDNEIAQGNGITETVTATLMHALEQMDIALKERVAEVGTSFETL